MSCYCSDAVAASKTSDIQMTHQGFFSQPHQYMNSRKSRASFHLLLLSIQQKILECTIIRILLNSLIFNVPTTNISQCGQEFNPNMLGQKSAIYPNIHILKISFLKKKNHTFKVPFFTEFTLSKSHFSQNSHFASLIFHSHFSYIFSRFLLHLPL